MSIEKSINGICFASLASAQALSVAASPAALVAFAPSPAAAQACLLDTNGDGTATDGVDATGSAVVGAGALACGVDASATGDFSQAFGADASATGAGGIAIGDLADSQGDTALAIGPGATTDGEDSIGIGRAAEISGPGNVAIGAMAEADGVASTAVGAGAEVLSSGSSAFGAFSSASANNSTALGADSVASAEGATAVGEDAEAIGIESFAGAENAIASGDNAIAIGSDADNDDIGATASAAGAVAIGADAEAANANSVALGAGAETTRSDQIALGTGSSTVTVSGIASDASRAAQGGPVELVTADANGNLATDDGASLAQITQNAADISLLQANSVDGERFAAVEAAANANAASVANLENRFALFDNSLEALNDAVAANREEIRETNDGVAVAMAMAGNTWLQQNETFAVSANWGNFGGSNGMAFSAAARISNRASFNAGLGVATRTGKVGARAGVRLGW